MPPSKQARSRQAKQKDRLAAAAVRKQERQRRRRRAGATALVFMIVIVVLLAVVLNGVNSGTGSGNKASSPTTVAPTTPPTTAAALASVKGKPCVAVKGPLPKGAPAVPVQTGAPPTALVKKDLTVGTGAEVKAGATASVNYIGVACSSGTIFGSSYQDGQPFDANLSASGGLIKGWQEGIPGMRVGGSRLLGIPPDLAYPNGRASIPPGETLWFVVNVTGVK